MLKKNILGITKNELIKGLDNKIFERYRIKQIYHSIYERGILNFEEMKLLNQNQREYLKENYMIDYGKIYHENKSKIDQTIKLLLDFKGNKIETVIIQEEDGRKTLCISSQVGCSLNCSFCKTGTQKFERNLKTEEIISQYLHSKKYVEKINNIVFMGQGEPLLNYKNLKSSIEILKEEDGIHFSKRKIIVSTSGIVPIMERAVNELNIELAISLHATTDELRDILVPINKQYSIRNLLEICKSISKKTPSKQLTFEYVMLKDVNDLFDDAKRLTILLKDIPCSINLIAFNEWDGSNYQCSDYKNISLFSEYLYNKGINAPIRWSKGKDIHAACGQLKSSNLNKQIF